VASSRACTRLPINDPLLLTSTALCCILRFAAAFRLARFGRRISRDELFGSAGSLKTSCKTCCSEINKAPLSEVVAKGRIATLLSSRVFPARSTLQMQSVHQIVIASHRERERERARFSSFLSSRGFIFVRGESTLIPLSLSLSLFLPPPRRPFVTRSRYFFRFPRRPRDATRPAGIQSRMAFYKCKFLIKVGVGLQIRKEAKFPPFLRRGGWAGTISAGELRASKEGTGSEGGAGGGKARPAGNQRTYERRVTSAAAAT